MQSIESRHSSTSWTPKEALFVPCNRFSRIHPYGARNNVAVGQRRHGRSQFSMSYLLG